tara:strand:+ start:184 stop:390 length:207 start_codon:yes stop_codon:yes gene_type:complete
MSVDYRNDIQLENEYLSKLEISVDTQHQNGISYKTQLLDALETIAEMESEILRLKQRLVRHGFNEPRF